MRPGRCLVVVLTAACLMAGLTAAGAQTVKPVPRSQIKKPEVMTPQGQTTWVRTGFFNEVDATERTTATINEVGVLRFRWGTPVAGVEEGFWRLRRRLGNNQFSLVATGIATSGTGGRFDIDFSPYLPGTAPLDGEVYHLEVVARRKAKVDRTTAVRPGQSGTPIPAQELGAWSAPVVITYVANTSPPTQFDFGTVYGKATLHIDRIMLVRDQYGPGQEEYHIKGFVQELQRTCPPGRVENCPFSTALQQHPVGPYRRDLNPPGEAPLGWSFDPSRNPPVYQVRNSFEFALGSGGNSLTSQRRFVLTLSIMEEDAGSSIDEWTSAINRLADVVRHGNLLGLSEQDIKRYLEEHIQDIIRYVADGLQIFTRIAEVGEAAPFVGTAIAVAAHAGVAIVRDLADDYYGTRSAHLTLESNREEDVHKLPGRLVGSGAARRYVTRSQTIRFTGPPPANAAAAFDGIVDVEFHWEFSDRRQR